MEPAKEHPQRPPSGEPKPMGASAQRSPESITIPGGRPFEPRFEDLPRIREADTEVRPFEVRFADLPRLRDQEPGVRPFELRFEDLPRVREDAVGIRPFEERHKAADDRGIEAGAAAFGDPDRS